MNYRILLCENYFAHKLYVAFKSKLFGKDMLLLELYDTAIVPFDDAPFQSVAETLSDIADYEAPPRWYDSLRLAGSIGKVGKKMHRARFDAAALAFAETYRNAEAPDTADKDAKRIKTEAYSEGLLQNGGASTDLFVKKLGAEKTARLFRTLLFRFQPEHLPHRTRGGAFFHTPSTFFA